MSNDLTRMRRQELLMLAGRLSELREPHVQTDRDELNRMKTDATRHKFRARERCDALLRIDPKVRHQEATADKRYHSPALLQLLLKRAQAEIHNDPKTTRSLAELALTILDGMWPSPVYPHATLRDLAALAHAYLGNVCRFLCEWHKAHQRFDHAYGLLFKGTGDPEIHAQINWHYGALLMDQQHHAVARQFLLLAQDDYQALGQPHNVGLVLLTMSGLYRNMGDPEGAIKVHMQACGLIDETKDPRLGAAAWNNLAHLLCDQGRYEEADSILADLPTVYELLPAESSIHLSLTWARGRIATGLGDLTRAERCFASATTGYVQLGDLYNVALASLDLLRAYFHHHRYTDIERLAAEVFHLLQDQPLERQAVEALHLLMIARTRSNMVEQALDHLAAELARNPFPGKRSPISAP